MTFDDLEFDYVIDKGTLDALVCSRDWNITSKLLREMNRVCKYFMLLITYATPEGRRHIFD